MTTTQAAAARLVSYQFETLWDFDYEPTHEDLHALYETAKKNQWNGSTAIDWSRAIGRDGPVLNVASQRTSATSPSSAPSRPWTRRRAGAWRISPSPRATPCTVATSARASSPSRPCGARWAGTPSRSGGTRSRTRRP